MEFPNPITSIETSEEAMLRSRSRHHVFLLTLLAQLQVAGHGR